MPDSSKTSLTQQLQNVLATADLPALGPERRPGAKSTAALSSEIKPLLAGVTPELQQKLRSAALLWHDHLDESHTISQDIHDGDGSFLHGIMHRREPDYGNAKYWFHRVGTHPCFPEMARRAGAWLDARGETPLKAALCPGGEWDACAFIDACEQANRRDGASPRKQLLQEIQRIEFDVLLEHLCASA